MAKTKATPKAVKAPEVVLSEKLEPNKEYFIYLENLRKSGVTNMFGAGPFLQEEFNLDSHESRRVLSDWMTNYTELSKAFGWRE
jgi:hypothetical protein